MQADVRDPKALHAAVKQTIDTFGRIDFVICGETGCLFRNESHSNCLLLGAAGNFLAPIASLSENALRTVIEIDTVGRHGFSR